MGGVEGAYKYDGLDREATVVKNATVQLEGHRQVQRQIEFCNLDAIHSVGYRVNSRRAVQFRQWATGIIREHLTINVSTVEPDEDSGEVVENGELPINIFLDLQIRCSLIYRSLHK